LIYLFQQFSQYYKKKKKFIKNNIKKKKKKELKELKEDSVIYKMIGPVLVKQDKADATQNVDKRLEYINGEM